MKDLVFRFLQSSGIEPIYLVTGILDIISLSLWRALKKDLSDSQRALYKSVILVATALTAYAFCKFFGLLGDWKELESVWSS